MKGQPTWVESKLPDLRTLARELRTQAIEEVIAATSHEDAIEVTAQHLGFNHPSILSLSVGTPLGEVSILRSSIYHIVEKRTDARERYVRLALDTLTGPLEIWKVAFTDGTDRLAFIGAYESKRQMLVSVVIVHGQVLWNYMHTDAKSLNKHRHGDLLYKRYSLFEGKEKGLLVTVALELEA
ncbi:PBECR2 nuclease fold domain-containing protein [Pseudomonas sp. A34-9]|uniref:PBECR2 nuclease fold domain-containing protein n=1 Tax=Pseudomonas sp. A34-9 TaxID=3034675 RepID=UPI00240DD236|nr:PBECR2 nuclease fold domain-containing protein [Pseudomonas sp. A34-9]